MTRSIYFHTARSTYYTSPLFTGSGVVTLTCVSGTYAGSSWLASETALLESVKAGGRANAPGVIRTTTVEAVLYPEAVVVAEGRPFPVPMMTSFCCGCGEPVNLTDTGAYIATRVNGDSGQGYEPECRKCLAAWRAEIDAPANTYSCADHHECHSGRRDCEQYDPAVERRVFEARNSQEGREAGRAIAAAILGKAGMGGAIRVGDNPFV